MKTELSPLEALDLLCEHICNDEKEIMYKSIIETALKEKDIIEKELQEKKNSVGVLLIQLEKYDKIIKAFEIIKEKRVNVWCISRVGLERYNNEFMCQKERELTQEEYDLLKEVLL